MWYQQDGCKCNEEIICQLESAINQNVVLFTIDSFAYYAKLEKIICDRLAVLKHGQGQSAVIVRLPDQTFVPQGTGVVREKSTFVDLCSVVGVTTGLNCIPEGFVWVPDHTF